MASSSVSMGASTGSSYLLHACILLLLLIVTLVQVAFFAFLPDVALHEDHCNASLAATPRAEQTSAALHTPVHLLYRSLYLSPKEIALREKEEHERIEQERALAAMTAAKKTPKIRGDKKHRHHQDDRGHSDALGLLERKREIEKAFFLQTIGQGHEPLNSTAAYCINLICPTDSHGVLQDFELYLHALPSSRPVYGYKGLSELPPSVVDIYLERHPVDKKYYPKFQHPRDKAIWMMQNAEFFDRHELANPDVGVMIVKNRISLKKVLEYRYRHQMGYSVVYTKHTSNDVFQPDVERDWNSFLHIAGWSPFKNTRVIIQAWARHPEWPKLVIRVIKEEVCAWITDAYGAGDAGLRLPNVDFKCGVEPQDVKNTLQNRIGLHLCPSETEGFGHYINEARSVGALILTTDVAPMNELVDSKSGVLVGQARDWWWQTKGDLFMPMALVTVEDIERGVEQILLMTVEERQRMGRRARAKYLEDRTYFLNAMAAIEASLCQDAIQIDKLQPYLY